MLIELSESELALLRVLLRSAGMVVVGAAATAHHTGIPVGHDEAACLRAVMDVAPGLLAKLEVAIIDEEKGPN